VSSLRRRSLLGLFASAALVAGCASNNSSLQLAPSEVGPAVLINSGQPMIDARCKSFMADFDEVVACQRANGTLDSFSSTKITWRVRYFVRYLEMPCNEAPTVEEGYVFHAVIDDLNDDEDLNTPQRVAIRNAMFNGTVSCK
jgi:hypothetical protein